MWRFSSTVSCAKMRRPSGTCTTPRVTTSCGGTCVMSSPSKRTLPSLGTSRPLTVLSVVVLPAPLAPMSVTISPSSTLIETPRRAWILP